jgi:cell cycle arrest protein BUB3
MSSTPSSRAANALVATHQLPSKVYCASFAPASSSLVVSMAHRNVHVYDVRRLDEPKQKRESALKFMTRSVACMADGKGKQAVSIYVFTATYPYRYVAAGWASGSIEGRIAVEYFDAELESRKYAFRCHRQTIDGVDCVYPINALAYHPM